ncbi:hypothetical protein SKAU_G00272600 [Synaphobranchus kaupii]|uniref:Uncharacterized protein n=1 Tax=Synaphobranchus kaupii TaxID=118154 RepID=A0A9Q1F0W9_SYNKA|nr:hypothetical protein SKAU_G00272600 [Synaphobranchus kaupii]
MKWPSGGPTVSRSRGDTALGQANIVRPSQDYTCILLFTQEEITFGPHNYRKTRKMHHRRREGFRKKNRHVPDF